MLYVQWAVAGSRFWRPSRREKGLRAYHARAGSSLGSRGLVVLAPFAAARRSWLLAPRSARSCCPAAPPALSPDCSTKRIAGERFRRPLRSAEPGCARQARRQGAGDRLVVDGRRRRLLAVGHLHRQARDLARRRLQGHGLRRGRPRPVRRGGAGRRRPHEARGRGDQARPRRLAGRHQRRAAPRQPRQLQELLAGPRWPGSPRTRSTSC